jgi:hypothetical protein
MKTRLFSMGPRYIVVLVTFNFHDPASAPSRSHALNRLKNRRRSG